MCLNGQSCCNSMKISNVSSIRINGDSVMSDSVILSNGNDIELLINGSNNNNNNLYCNSSDLCYIYCESILSCQYLYIYCFGQCFVDCSGSSYYCPSVGYGEYFNWNATSPDTTLTTLTTLTITSEQPVEDKKNNSDVWIIIVGVLVGLAIVMRIVYVICKKRKRDANLNDEKNADNNDGVYDYTALDDHEDHEDEHTRGVISNNEIESASDEQQQIQQQVENTLKYEGQRNENDDDRDYDNDHIATDINGERDTQNVDGEEDDT